MCRERNTFRGLIEAEMIDLRCRVQDRGSNHGFLAGLVLEEEQNYPCTLIRF
jgi:hypothetical protein